MLVVTAPGKDTEQKPTIAGLDKFRVIWSGIKLAYYNGHATMTYSHQIRIDEPGHYALGPAALTINGKVERSNVVHITVDAQQVVINPAYQKKQQALDAFIRLSTDKTRAYVGEAITYTLTLFSKPDSVKITPHSCANSTEYDYRARNRAGHHTRRIDGQLYNVTKKQIQIFPTVAGTLTIPAGLAVSRTNK